MKFINFYWAFYNTNLIGPSLLMWNWFSSVPFDTKKPLGFYVVFILQCLSGTSYMLLVSLFSGLFIGMCTYIHTCLTDLSTFVDQLNEISAKKRTTETQDQIDVLCSEMLQFHIDVLK